MNNTKHLQQRVLLLEKRNAAQHNAEVLEIAYIINWTERGANTEREKVGEVHIMITPPTTGTVKPGHSSLRAYLEHTAHEAIAAARARHAARVPVKAFVESQRPHGDVYVDYRRDILLQAELWKAEDGAIIFET